MLELEKEFGGKMIINDDDIKNSQLLTANIKKPSVSQESDDKSKLDAKIKSVYEYDGKKDFQKNYESVLRKR